MQSIVGEGRWALLLNGKVIKRFKTEEELHSWVRANVIPGDWAKLKQVKTHTVRGL